MLTQYTAIFVFAEASKLRKTDVTEAVVNEIHTVAAAMMATNLILDILTSIVQYNHKIKDSNDECQKSVFSSVDAKNRTQTKVPK